MKQLLRIPFGIMLAPFAIVIGFWLWINDSGDGTFASGKDVWYIPLCLITGRWEAIQEQWNIRKW